VFNWKAAACRAGCAVAGILLSQQPATGASCLLQAPASPALPAPGTSSQDVSRWDAPSRATPSCKSNQGTSPAAACNPALPTSCPRTVLWREKTQQSGSYPCALLSVGSWKSWEADRALGGRSKERESGSGCCKGQLCPSMPGACCPGMTPASAH